MVKITLDRIITMLRIKNIIKNKILNIIIYFYYTAKPKKINPINYLRDLNEKKSQLFIKKISNLQKYLDEVSNKSNSTGVNYSDHKILYETIRSVKPKYILELGSGISSTTICYALRENKELDNIEGKLISIEENDNYFNEVKKITSPDLLPFVDFILSQRETKKIMDMKGCFYNQIPRNNYDIVFIDGPTLRGIPPNYRESKAFNSAILNLLSNNSYVPSHIFLDQRIDSMWSLKKCLPETKFKYYVSKVLTRIYFIKNQKIIN